MRILHTSDWHIGKKLKEHDRSDEFRKFLEWLGDVIAAEKPDAVIVAGDVFDSRSPSAESQEMYYSFFARTAGTSCRDAVIISGNHDSPALIDAPAGVMGRCNIHVIGRPRENEIITINDSDGRPGIIVCAVPFLRDKDLGTVRDGDTFPEIERGIKEGIMSHYAGIFGKAREIRGDMDIPIVAAGHLFLEAGKTLTDEGERSMYLGTAVKVGTDIFPEDVAYVALGHLHSPQKVGRENIRYSGSPVALTFGEWGVRKTVSIVDFDGRNFAGVKEIPVPVWQKMARISGDMAGIEAELRGLMGMNESVWAEVTY
ncbi:MAG: exonuclease subunit SbcD, partial [Synergistaceae bacterium]|nr:exonuclease subunit SbcD [Synergistaceae bacterium]